MLLYSYICLECGHEFENRKAKFLTGKEDNKEKCPQCGGLAKRKVTSFAFRMKPGVACD